MLARASGIRAPDFLIADWRLFYAAFSRRRQRLQYNRVDCSTGGSALHAVTIICMAIARFLGGCVPYLCFDCSVCRTTMLILLTGNAYWAILLTLTLAVGLLDWLSLLHVYVWLLIDWFFFDVDVAWGLE